MEFHQARRALAAVALFASPEPWTGGVVETDSHGRVCPVCRKARSETGFDKSDQRWYFSD
jgi:hypothetical protein